MAHSLSWLKQCKQKNTAVNSKRPSLPSEPILSITSWFAKVIHVKFLHLDPFVQTFSTFFDAYHCNFKQESIYWNHEVLFSFSLKKQTFDWPGLIIFRYSLNAKKKLALPQMYMQNVISTTLMTTVQCKKTLLELTQFLLSFSREKKIKITNTINCSNPL